MTILDTILVLGIILSHFIVPIIVLIGLLILLWYTKARIHNLPKTKAPFDPEKSKRAKVIGVFIIWIFTVFITMLFYGSALISDPSGALSELISIIILLPAFFITILALNEKFTPFMRRKIIVPKLFIWGIIIVGFVLFVYLTSN